MGRRSTEITSQAATSQLNNGSTRKSVNGNGRATDDKETISTISNEWTIAILESRDVTHQVGLAAINNETGRISLTQIADSVTYLKTMHHISLHSPCTILVCSTSVGRNAAEQSAKSMLVAELLENYRPTNIKSMQRKYFNDVKGLEDIDQLIVEDADKDATMMILRAKYYAVAAAAALFSYLESTQSIIFAPNSLSITYQEHKGTMFIEPQTAQDLELATSALGTNGVTLLSLLDNCLTPMGRRLLRSSILQPLSDKNVIQSRLDAVTELKDSEDILSSVRTAFKSLKGIDVDKVLMAVSKNDGKNAQDFEVEKRIGQLLTIRTVIHALSNIHFSLDGAASALLKNLQSDLHDDVFGRLIAIIDNSIDENVNFGKAGGLAARNAKMYAIKAKRCQLLDVARDTYRENVDDLFDLTSRYADTYGLPIACTFINNTFQMTLKVSELGDSDLPKEFINVSKHGSKSKKTVSENNASRLRFTSIELLKRNSRINEALKEVYALSKQCVMEIRLEVVDALSALYIASDAVAMLDFLMSLASAAIVHDYVKPDFVGVVLSYKPRSHNKTAELALKSARHPLLEKLQSDSLISNDVFLSDFAHFQIIEGPNMSGTFVFLRATFAYTIRGKSSFLRMVALIVIMAGLGSYVPAEYASIKLMDGIFSRQTNNDILEQNLSTFAHEMATVSLILSASTPNTLIILDEIGRGTTPSEGFGLAYAISEELIRRKSYTLFATHYRQLSTYLELMPGVVTLHLATEVNTSNELDFTYRIVEGSSSEQHYGLQLAKTAGLPAEVMHEARTIVGELAQEEGGVEQERGRVLQEARTMTTRKQAILSVTSKLRQITKSCTLSYEELMAYIARLQRELVVTLERTGMGGSDGDDEDRIVEEESQVGEAIEQADEAPQSSNGDSSDENADVVEKRSQGSDAMHRDGSSSNSIQLASSPMFISEEEDL